jgi:AMMECR1 domain-containing protein
MSRALSGARGRPISPGELAALETEVSRVANSQRVNFSGDDAASKFVGVVNTAVNNLTRAKQADDRQLSPIARGIK